MPDRAAAADRQPDERAQTLYPKAFAPFNIPSNQP